MKNQVAPGKAMNVICPAGGMISGLVYVFNAMFGVSSATYGVGDTGVIYTEGVFNLPKVSAQAWVVGIPVYWDPVALAATTAAGALVKIGVATDFAANPSPTGNVRLNSSF